jgi:Protein of unknown function (DUF2281)
MLTTIEGIYENGQITLDHKPLDIQKAEVTVVFKEKKSLNKKRKLGTLKGLIQVPDDFNEPLEDLEQFWS